MTDQATPKKPTADTNIKEEPASEAQKKTIKVILIVVGCVILLGIAITAMLAFFGARIGISLLEQATDSNVNITDDSLTVKSSDNEYEFSNNQELARGFPDEVSIYEPSEVISSARTKQGEETAWSANLTTNDSATDVFDFYEDSLSENGWEVQSSYESEGMSSLGASNESANLQIQVSIFADNSNGTATISLAVLETTE